MNKTVVAVASVASFLFVAGEFVGCEPTVVDDEQDAGNDDANDAGADDAGDGGACVPTSLDIGEQTLSLGLLGFIDIAPGQVFTPTVGYEECCPAFQPLPDACVEFSFSRDATGTATLDVATGVVRIDENAPDNTSLGLIASVDDGAHMARLTLNIFDPAQNPFVGTWHQTATLECGTGAEVDPGRAIEDVSFFGNRRFHVTHTVFELLWVDYSGAVSFDVERGTFSFATSRGAGSLPEDVDGDDGTFELDADGRLILRDLWLGTFSDDMVEGCGVVLER